MCILNSQKLRATRSWVSTTCKHNLSSALCLLSITVVADFTVQIELGGSVWHTVFPNSGCGMDLRSGQLSGTTGCVRSQVNSLRTKSGCPAQACIHPFLYSWRRPRVCLSMLFHSGLLQIIVLERQQHARQQTQVMAVVSVTGHTCGRESMHPVLMLCTLGMHVAPWVYRRTFL